MSEDLQGHKPGGQIHRESRSFRPPDAYGLGKIGRIQDAEFVESHSILATRMNRGFAPKEQVSNASCQRCT